MAARNAKVAVSIPRELLARVERARRKGRTSRSAVVQDALRLWIARQDEDARVGQYIEGYRRAPEGTREIKAAEAAAVRLFAAEDW